MESVFLGRPPDDIKRWIIDHCGQGPAGNPYTTVTFVDDSVSAYDWSGAVTQRTLIDAGLAEEDYDGDEGHSFYYLSPDIKSVEFGTAVSAIGAGAFDGVDQEGRTNLQSVVISDTVTNIGSGAFAINFSLSSVVIGDNVTGIGYSAFEGCPLLSVHIPDSVQTIGEFAFLNTGTMTATTDKTIAQIEAMSGRYWGLSTVIHCADGDIAINPEE